MKNSKNGSVTIGDVLYVAALILVYAGIIFIATGGTKQLRARHWGAATTNYVANGHKLVIATWKNGNLWLLTKKMDSNDVAETYDFNESSGYGFLQGKITIIETPALK